MTTNDAWNPKIRGLREKSLILNYKKIGIRDGVPYLRQLLTKKGIEADDSMSFDEFLQNYFDEE